MLALVAGGIEIALLGSHFLPSSKSFPGSEEVPASSQGEGSLTYILPPARKSGPVPVTVSVHDQNLPLDGDKALLLTYQDDLYKEL